MDRTARSIHATSEIADKIQAVKEELRSRVLTWSMSDITSPILFKNQVGTIPDKFYSVDQYRHVFRTPLLEEIRAQLHQAFEKNMKSESVFSMKITRIIRTGRKEEQRKKKFLNIHLFARASWQSSTIRQADLILLCNEVPKWDSKRDCMIQTYKSNYILAIVHEAEEGSPFITAIVYVQDGSSAFEEMKSPLTSWYVISLSMSLIPGQRIWSALHEVIPAKKVPIIQSILQIEHQTQPTGNCLLMRTQGPDQATIINYVEAYCKSRRLNNSQEEALISTLAGLFTKEISPHVRMVQGPPGTGKTSMLVTLLSVLGCLKCRTIVAAPTNAAVVELCKRIMSFFQVPNDGVQQIQLFSSFCERYVKGKRNAASSQYTPLMLELREIVLVGSEERLKGAVDGTLLQEVFLPYRVQRLKEALSPKTGWKGSIHSVIGLLKNNVHGQLGALTLKAEAAQGAQGSSNKNKEKAKTTAAAKENLGQLQKIRQQRERENTKSFWSSARKSMAKLQVQMKNSSSILTKELPRCHLDLHTCKAMIAASNLMESLVVSMPKKAPLDATSWFKADSTLDTMTEHLANMDLQSNKSTDSSLKGKFLQAKVKLLEALRAKPGCTLFISEKHPQGQIPSVTFLMSECFRNATLVFSTVSSAGGSLMEGATFECGIIDEATQLVEAETTIITNLRALKQLILVGDHKQLPATVISKVAQKCGYGRSLFDRLQSLRHGCRHLLNMQYRMNPAISKFPNSQFYHGKVQDGPNVLSADYGKFLSQSSQYGPYAFLDCKNGAEVTEKRSWKNPVEVELVISLVKHLCKVNAARTMHELSIGVISPYAMQVEAVKKSLERHNLERNIDIEVKTVDGFQGREKDVIIFTVVRANQDMKIGFVDDHRRLNVAITRGRHCVWIVGNARTLSGGGHIWKKLIDDAKSRKCFHSP